MNYIYCGAHGSLLFALSLKEHGKEITVIAFNEDVIKYCVSEKIKHIQLKNVRFTTKTVHRLFSIKKTLDKLIKKINFSEKDFFFLTSRTKAFDAFYLAKELKKKKGTILYKYSYDVELKKFKPTIIKPFFLSGSITKLALKFTLGLDLVHYQISNTPCLGIDERFYKKNEITEYEPNKTFEQIINR